uniref:Uncharacterized protein n=1 Tax=Plectus sambesii TaxID=2011161 RepID=A0A914XH82_9BILA
MSTQESSAVRSLTTQSLTETPAQWTKATYSRMVPVAGDRLLLVMRAGERIDRAFPGWQHTDFTDMGSYYPTDANMPMTLAKAGSRRCYTDDSPLTELGELTARVIGRALFLRHLVPAMIVCSPALRCVQTAAAVAVALGRDTLVRVEPGLFEALAWYDRRPPVFLTEEELIANPFRVDPTYRPIVSRESLAKRAEEGESKEELYERLASTVRQLSARARTGPLLIVGHAVTVDACARRLVGKAAAANEATMARLGQAIPYCSLLALRQPDDALKSSFSYVDDVIPDGVSTSPFFRDIDVDFINRQ